MAFLVPDSRPWVAAEDGQSERDTRKQGNPDESELRLPGTRGDTAQVLDVDEAVLARAH